MRRAVNVWANLLPLHCTKVTDIEDMVFDGGNSKDMCMQKQVTGQAYVWCIWKGRNEAIFNNKEFNSLRTANEIQSSVFLWYSSRGAQNCIFDWNQWCCNPLSVFSVVAG